MAEPYGKGPRFRPDRSPSDSELTRRESMRTSVATKSPRLKPDTPGDILDFGQESANPLEGLASAINQFFSSPDPFGDIARGPMPQTLDSAQLPRGQEEMPMATMTPQQAKIMEEYLLNIHQLSPNDIGIERQRIESMRLPQAMKTQILNSLSELPNSKYLQGQQ